MPEICRQNQVISNEQLRSAQALSWCCWIFHLPSNQVAIETYFEALGGFLGLIFSEMDPVAQDIGCLGFPPDSESKMIVHTV